MAHPVPILAALSASLLLGGYSAGVQPRIGTGHEGAAPPAVALALAEETHRRLAAEFVQQDVAFELAGTRLWSNEAGGWRVRAEGTADFGADGQATATIEAVYDPEAARWTQLEYQLL